MLAVRVVPVEVVLVERRLQIMLLLVQVIWVAVAVAVAMMEQTHGMEPLAGLVSSLFDMQILTRRQFLQPAHQQLQLLAAIAFTNGLALGALPSDERNNGALC